jgi:hypothetical protein
MSLLGATLTGHGRYTEPERSIVGGYEGLKAREDRIPATNRSHFRQAAERVIHLFEDSGQTGRADAWKARVGMPDLPADVFSPP